MTDRQTAFQLNIVDDISHRICQPLMTVFMTTDRDAVPVYQEELFMLPGLDCMG